VRPLCAFDLDHTLVRSPLDLVRLKFAKVTQRFFTQNPDGTSGQPVVSSFDYKTNTAGP